MGKSIVRVFFDTETYTNYNQISLPYIIGWITDLDINDFQYSTEPHTKFFAMLEELAENYSVQLWAHNVQYDLYNLYPTYLGKLPHHRPEKTWQHTENGDFLSFSYIGNKGNKIKFKAYCTYKWNRGALAAWANDLKLSIKKGEIDYEKHGYCSLQNGRFYYENREGDEEKSSSLEDELDYLKNDVFILYKIWERITEQKRSILELYGFKAEKRDPATIPAFGKMLVNRLMGGNDRLDLYTMTYKNIVDKTMGQAMEMTRMGGFTAYNRNIPSLIFEEPEIKTYDVNSKYPWIMMNGLPAGPFVPQSDTTMVWYLCRIKSIKWKKEWDFFSRGPVPHRFLNNDVFICEMYLNTLYEMTDIDIEIEKDYYQECGTRVELEKLIDKMYDIKSDPNVELYVKEGSKKTMNCQFGKFMQKNYHKNYYYDIEEGGVIEYLPEGDSIYRNNLTGCYIVQVAQSILLYNIMVEHRKGNTFIYCDTDSLKMHQKTPPSFRVGDGLGEWKLEGEYHIYMNNGKAKKYFLWNHNYTIDKQQIKISGIENRIKGWMINNFTLDDYKVLFDRNNNVKIVNGKVVNKKSKLGQPLLTKTDIEFNKGRPVTHRLDTTMKSYLWKVRD